MDKAKSKICGAIIAGGQSQRFGSDKRLALFQGKALVDHILDAMMPQCDAMVMCGPAWRDYQRLNDRPYANIGPLGGLCAALHYAHENGYDYVLSSTCDSLPVVDAGPLIAAAAINGRACYVDGQYLIGLWPVSLSAILDSHLQDQNNLSLRHWIQMCDAQAVVIGQHIYNINSPDDLADYANKF